MQIPQHQGDAELYTIHRQSFQAMEAYKKIQRTQQSVDGFLPASASSERLNLFGRNQYQLPTVKCYRIFSLWLLLAVLVPVFGMYLISDFLCTDTLICMRITVSIGLVFALIALFISAWYERKYRRCKSLLRSIRPGLEI